MNKMSNHGIINMVSAPPYASVMLGHGKGVYDMSNIIVTFIVSVAAGVISNYISKWLDR
ncbi:MAG: hypothetical protein IJ583_06215 [Firmicutes bacterium]|nr:hypothetical protein [Bacillota bacterium]